MSKKHDFKCVEDPVHVQSATQQNFDKDTWLGAVEFFHHFEVPCRWTSKSAAEAYEACETNEDRHNLFHLLGEDLIKAQDAGNSAVCDEMFIDIMKELRIVNQKCKHGEDHE